MADEKRWWQRVLTAEIGRKADKAEESKPPEDAKAPAAPKPPTPRKEKQSEPQRAAEAPLDSPDGRPTDQVMSRAFDDLMKRYQGLLNQQQGSTGFAGLSRQMLEDAEREAASVRMRARQEADVEAGRIVTDAKRRARETIVRAQRQAREAAEKETQNIVEAAEHRARVKEEQAQQMAQLFLVRAREDVQKYVTNEANDAYYKLLSSLQDILGTAQGIEAGWQKRTSELWDTSPFQLEGEGAGSLNLEQPETDGVVAPAEEEVPQEEPSEPEDLDLIPEESETADFVDEGPDIEAPAGEEALDESEIPPLEELQAQVEQEAEEELDDLSEVGTVVDEALPVEAPQDEAPQDEWEADLTIEPEPIGDADDEDLISPDGLPSLDGESVEQWDGAQVTIDGVVQEVPPEVVPVDAADYAELELEPEPELEPDLEGVDDDTEAEPTPDEEPAFVDNTAVFEAQSEIELVLKPLADMTKIVKFYGQLQKMDGLRVKSTSGSWDRGTTINVVLDRPLPLYQLFSQMADVQAQPAKTEGDGLLATALSQIGTRPAARPRIAIAFPDSGEPLDDKPDPGEAEDDTMELEPETSEAEIGDGSD